MTSLDGNVSRCPDCGAWRYLQQSCQACGKLRDSYAYEVTR